MHRRARIGQAQRFPRKVTPSNHRGVWATEVTELPLSNQPRKVVGRVPRFRRGLGERERLLRAVPHPVFEFLRALTQHIRLCGGLSPAQHLSFLPPAFYQSGRRYRRASGQLSQRHDAPTASRSAARTGSASWRAR